ncbi:MAG: hypothetical protein DWQ05_16785 [Calditrichaeota bacterium]|nr:MAG: hypothetical protein DWQ05_16785 [Calditrichota bacterium]
MTINFIPQQLKSDHLFLLIGANTLPNWIAANLLLQENGQLYLIHSQETYVTTQQLATRFVEHEFKQPIYIDVSDGSDAQQIYRNVATAVKRIRDGHIGLNYSGGTKVMAVQSYRAVEDELAFTNQSPVFSYLNARTLELCFDGKHPLIFVGDNIQLTIKDFFYLHFGKDWAWEQSPTQQVIAQPIIDELVKVHNRDYDYRLWKDQFKILNQQKGKVTLEWHERLTPLAQAIAADLPLTSTVQQVCDQQTWPFEKPTQLVNWLEGKWLESYVLSVLQTNKARYGIYDFGQGLEARTTGERIEVDVIATKGYQFHLLSCYEGSNKNRAKEHLFEAYMRATQIGGEEACTVLICQTEEPESLEHDAALLWQAHDRIKVFGRRDLEDLADLLEDWFNRKMRRR